MWPKATEKDFNMSQHDFNIANQGFPAFRSDLNDALVALASNSSGASAPSTTYANQLWYDDANNLLKMRDEANANWITLGTLDQVAKTFSVPALTGVTASAAELNVVDGADTTLAPAILANPKNYIDPENRIINGAFDFWQRGTSFTANAYGADRWINGVAGGTVTMSRQAFTLGDTLGSNSPTYFLRQTVSGQSTSSQLALVSQRVEGVRSYAGQTITVLGWARRSSGSGNMALNVEQAFGTGGSPSSGVYGAGQTVTLTSSWAAFALTFSVPSIAGKTLGTNGNDYLALNIWTSGGSDYNSNTNSLGLQTIGVDLWGVHIKVGTHTTAATDLYKQPELGPELARCQRYYEVLPLQTSINYNLISTLYGGTVYWAKWDYRVTKRAPATITGGSGFTGAFASESAVYFNNNNSNWVSTAVIYADSEL
jgi:hypothetical protein